MENIEVITFSMMNTWQQILDTLEKTVNPGAFKVWITPLNAEFRGEVLHLTAPNPFVAAWVRDRLTDEISEAAAGILGYRPRVEVDPGGGRPKTPSTAAASRSARRPAKAPAGRGPAAPPANASAGRAVQEQIGLPIAAAPRPRPARNWRFNFDDFVVGPSNELAFAAAKGLGQNSLVTEQLFISSEPGLGKTHLLNAVGQQLSAVSNKSQIRIECMTGEEFSNRLVMALKGREMDRFKAQYRDGVDVLLLEDIHFFQGKERFQGELLSTLKGLRDRGSKVMFTSSFLPHELKDVDGTLASRLCDGLMARIDRPDLETRRRILHAKARKFQVAVPEDVTDLLAERIQADVRKLESCLQNLILKARLLNQSITMDMAWQVLGNYASEDDTALNIRRITDFICRTFELSPDQLASKSRKRQIVLARNTAFFLARKYTELSLKDIGDHFNRRHSTVIKGITNIEREMRLETPLGRQISQTIDRISA